MQALLQVNIWAEGRTKDFIIEIAQEIERQTQQKLLDYAEREDLTEEEMTENFDFLGVQIVWLND